MDSPFFPSSTHVFTPGAGFVTNGISGFHTHVAKTTFMLNDFHIPGSTMILSTIIYNF